MAKLVNLDKMYLCVGENIKESVPIGNCGDAKKLISFLMICFPGKQESFIRDYFDGDEEKQVLEYILKNGGKRLKAL